MLWWKTVGLRRKLAFVRWFEFENGTILSVSGRCTRLRRKRPVPPKQRGEGMELRDRRSFKGESWRSRSWPWLWGYFVCCVVEDSETTSFIGRQKFVIVSRQLSHRASSMADDDSDEGFVDVGGGAPLDGGGAVAPSAGGVVMAPLDGVAPAEGQNNPGLPVGNNGGGEAVVAAPIELDVVLRRLQLLADVQQAILDRLAIVENVGPPKAQPQQPPLQNVYQPAGGALAVSQVLLTVAGAMGA